MIGNSSLLAAVLTVASVVSISLLSLLCLRCKRKSKIIHEETQIYDPQTFQRGGSVFAVMQSKTVTRSNHITSTTIETYEEEFSPSPTDEQSDYENITDAAEIETNAEHTYVDPLPAQLYVNEETPERITGDEQNTDVYANIFTSLSIKEDDDDYENSEFWEQCVQKPEKEQDEDDEPDYVNENGECA
ncbi:LAT2 domain-containing protein [Betta splendens]|uniref:LAT2 domain-containing protein n=1 Tax=Betta splendens TaxID=158456 RepID=A0A8M1HMH7_BETSP|nr:LAT2 domain-containing protein [Betta splendens]